MDKTQRKRPNENAAKEKNYSDLKLYSTEDTFNWQQICTKHGII